METLNRKRPQPPPEDASCASGNGAEGMATGEEEFRSLLLPSPMHVESRESAPAASLPSNSDGWGFDERRLLSFSGDSQQQLPAPPSSGALCCSIGSFFETQIPLESERGDSSWIGASPSGGRSATPEKTAFSRPGEGSAGQAPPVAGEDAPQSQQRYFLEYVVLKNFKSYAGEHVVGPLLSQVAVVGPNGAGERQGNVRHRRRRSAISDGDGLASDRISLSVPLRRKVQSGRRHLFCPRTQRLSPAQLKCQRLASLRRRRSRSSSGPDGRSRRSGRRGG